MQLQINNRFKELESYLGRIKLQQDAETQSYLCRFGAVLICGNIERCVDIIVLERLNARAHPRVLAFVKSYFMRGPNFDCNSIAQLLNRFDSDWYRTFQNFIDANPEIKEGISSCYSIRNSVAHGGTSSVGLKRLEELLNISKSLIDNLIASTA